MKKILLLLIILNIPFEVWSNSDNQIIEGYVFEDKNANNILDRKERGIKNSYVSNGKEIVITDRHGKYSLNATEDDVLFVIIPSGFKSSLKNNWYINISGSDTVKTKVFNFGLRRSENNGKFRFLAIGDVQVGSQEEILYASRTMVQELINRQDYDFSIYLGDMVNDSVELFKPLKKLIKEIKRPYKAVYGNHDRNFENPINKQKSNFVEKFGPTNYAFFHEDVLFVTLNSISPVGKYGYEGHYKKNTIKFLRNILKIVESNQLIVLNQHVPLSWMKNKEAVLGLLNIKNNILILSGHSHSINRRYYKRTGFNDIQELTAGTVSGNWWTGQKNWQGIPLALMKCGSPRGYFEVEVEGNSYNLLFKAIGLPEEHQTSIWFGDLEQNVPPITVDKTNHKIILNFFAGSSKTEIRTSLNGRPLGELQKHKMIDPYVARIKRWQNQEFYPNKLSKAAPYLRTPSSHIWTFNLPYEELSEINTLKIEIKDPSIKSISKEFIFWKKN